MSCANARQTSPSAPPTSPKHWNSRPLPPMSSRSSAARRSTCRRCLIPWSSLPLGYPRPTRLKSSDRPGKTRDTYSAASYRHTTEFNEYVKTLIYAPGRGGVGGRVLLEGKSVQITDVLTDPEYTFGETARLGNFRTILGVPLLREGIAIGLFLLHRAAVRPFTEKQIKLVETFADQAVIAIENVRLFEDVQQRTRELSESLEQQTATSEVLQVISSSPGDVEPVFQAMLENAVRICDATFGNIYRWDGENLHLVAASNTPSSFVQ